ncbi:MAG: zinc ABC transporter substrate-binding protein [Thermodesulfobacteriota bacteirum]|nr:zinc ABC transporter substrate-binding protein [Thermodesulfobacteriota bacterium]
MRYINTILITLTCLFLTKVSYAEDMKIVSSIKPLHSIVSNVVGDDNSVDLLLDGSYSPHNFQLKPSHIKILQNADVIFYIDDSSLETFLARPLKTIKKSSKKISIANNSKLTFHSFREGGIWEEKDSGDRHNHSHGEFDPHFWLDTNNVKKITKQVVVELSKVNPNKKTIYKKNAKIFIQQINEKKKYMATELNRIKNKPFIVFHDGYQYYEKEFGLNSAGSISVNHEISPTPKRIDEIKSKIRQSNVVCIFKEPQFSSKVVQTIIKDTNAKEGTMDPLGFDLEPGRDLYLQLMDKLTKSLKDCLS